MQASSVFARVRVRGVVALGALALASACHAEAKIHASTDESRSDGEESEPAWAPAPAPAPAQPVTAAPPAAPATPPADACPLSCYEARGSVRADLTSDELAQLRSALEPTMARMRSCASPDEWRRLGSATINLRIAPDGTLAELGVDPHHGHESACFDDAGRGASASLSLPGRKVVRCAERCVRQATPRAPGRRAR